MNVRRAAAEAMGTFFLVLVGTGTIMADDHLGGAIGPVGIALAFGLVVMVMIHATGHLSGAHLNPAVTIGLWSSGRFPAPLVPIYLIAQLVGAVAASTALAVVRAQLAVPISLGATTSQVGTALGLSVEFVLTFTLMFVILAMSTDARAAGRFAPLAIGATVTIDALLGGALTGASMNPARSFGPALLTGAWDGHWIYWLAPIAGARFAAHVHDRLRTALAPTT
ncbi:MAG: MIP family channel protein [Ardenticatenales bacterium]|nr:MIP family channel protein [Ardenticatenales bacterium]